jgi:hypothetical protein
VLLNLFRKFILPKKQTQQNQNEQKGKLDQQFIILIEKSLNILTKKREMLEKPQIKLDKIKIIQDYNRTLIL